jgi:outer membrane protein TolC
LAIVLTAPFAQLNQAKIATEVARIQYRKAVITFRKALLQALIDVNNALSMRVQLALEGDRFERSVGAAKVTEKLNAIRYQAGATSLQAWIDAQAARRAAEISLAGNHLSRLENYAMLCEALGGGANAAEQ